MIHILKNKKEWDQLIASFTGADFYHTYDYHHLSKKKNETPILIKYEEGAQIIALPLLIRNIDCSGFSDATSVYGYSGPLGHNITDGFDNSTFQLQLTQLFRKHKIVSVFSRLNPFITQQETLLKGMGYIAKPGNIVNIDLTKSLERQKQYYQKRLITYINKSRRESIIRKARTKEEILRFIELYYETMFRLEADECYYFSKQYFFGLLNSDDFNAEILLAIDKQSNEIMGGALFVKKNDTVQYHLSATSEEFLKLRPIKLLIDEMRIMATNEGYTHFNLGGGVGSKKDSLFYFKSGFSKDFRPFKLWKFIVDSFIYNQLLEGRNKDIEMVDQCSEFFPLYRYSHLENNLVEENV